jgi:hypothetical protein
MESSVVAAVIERDGKYFLCQCPQGALSTPAGQPLIFMFTGEQGEQYGYADGFREDGAFWRCLRLGRREGQDSRIESSSKPVSSLCSPRRGQRGPQNSEPIQYPVTRRRLLCT